MTCYLLRLLIFSLLIIPNAINAQQFEFVKSVDLKINNETIIYTANDLVVSGPQYGNKIIYSLKGERANPDEFSTTMPNHSLPLLVAKRTPNGEKYGLIGRNGQYLVACEYDGIDSWVFGFTIAKKDKILFMIDTIGNVFPLGDEVLSASIVMTGIVACKNKYGKYGLKDKKGTLIVDYKYKDISIVSNLEKEDFGVALVHDSNYNLGLINGEGKLVLPFSNENSYKATKRHLFIGKGKKSGILKPNKTIEFNIPFETTDLPFSHFGDAKRYGVYHLSDSYGMKCGIIDSNYNIVVPAKYRTLLMSDDYYAMGTDCSLMSPGNCSKMVAIISMLGDTILYDSFNLTTQFLGLNALITSKKVKEWYWYNEKGSLVLPFAINWPNWVYRENVIAEVLPMKALSSNEIFLYDKSGGLLTNDSFNSTSLIDDSPFVWVEKIKGKFGVLNVNGKWVIPCELGWPYSAFYNKNLKKENSEYLAGFTGMEGTNTVIYDKSGQKKFEGEGRLLFFTRNYLWLKKNTTCEIYSIKW